MTVSLEKRYEYWNHFIQAHAIGELAIGRVTAKRLASVKDQILMDNHFWSDVIIRHGGDRMTPEQMKQAAPMTYQHCAGNFAGMLCQSLRKKST